MTGRENFSAKLRANSKLVGAFQKFGHCQATELIATSDVDFVLIDTEHAPFSPDTLDTCLMVARALALPALVRIADVRTDVVLAALDMGATGLVVPHVTSGKMAQEIVALSRYRGGTRGFSPSTRAGCYGTCNFDEHVARSDRDTLIIAQIEEQAGLDSAEDIAATDGIDALFVGRADLALSLGCDWSAPVLDNHTHAIAAAARRHGKASGAVAAGAEQALSFRSLGIGFLVCGTDQSALRAGLNRMVESARRSAEI